MFLELIARINLLMDALMTASALKIQGWMKGMAQIGPGDPGFERTGLRPLRPPPAVSEPRAQGAGGGLGWPLLPSPPFVHRSGH
eukprot:gene17543-biopygen9847